MGSNLSRLGRGSAPSRARAGHRTGVRGRPLPGLGVDVRGRWPGPWDRAVSSYHWRGQDGLSHGGPFGVESSWGHRRGLGLGRHRRRSHPIFRRLHLEREMGKRVFIGPLHPPRASLEVPGFVGRLDGGAGGADAISGSLQVEDGDRRFCALPPSRPGRASTCRHHGTNWYARSRGTEFRQRRSSRIAGRTAHPPKARRRAWLGWCASPYPGRCATRRYRATCLDRSRPSPAPSGWSCPSRCRPRRVEHEAPSPPGSRRTPRRPLRGTCAAPRRRPLREPQVRRRPRRRSRDAHADVPTWPQGAAQAPPLSNTQQGEVRALPGSLYVHVILR